MVYRDAIEELNFMRPLPEAESHFYEYDPYQFYNGGEELDDGNDFFSNPMRWLAKKKEEKTSGFRMDYSALSVAVMTLGLIMVVEVVLHRLNHAAEGRPYFNAVLENIYNELAILGIVEFCVFLMQEYYEDYNKEKKNVFGAVHFALFYTALINAFQSILLAFTVGRVSKRMWVNTEALELNHYVEIREAFDRVSNELDRLHGVRGSTAGGSQSGSTDSSQGSPKKVLSRSNRSGQLDDDDGWSIEEAEHTFEFSRRGFAFLFQQITDRIRYPRLQAEYNALLMQVRFHEMKVHFLQAYGLSHKLKISEYLLRSQQHVLIKLVHISSTAWLLFTGCINVLYFVLGIVGTKTGDPSLVGTTLIYAFFSCLLLYIILALLLRKKVKLIFKAIMHRRDLWKVVGEDGSSEERERLSDEQLQLFWGGSPKLIIAALKSMQFGYAVALSTVIMFWDEISEGSVNMIWYWAAIVVCYALFLQVAAQVIPRYTLCTSLGQLVDQKRLNEVVAQFHLSEAKRQREAELTLRAHELDNDLKLAELPDLAEDEDESSLPSSSGGTSSLSAPSATATNTSSPEVSIADLVSVDTESLRTKLRNDIRGNMESQARPRRRPRRMKSVSDGVSLMASLRSVTGTPARPTQTQDDSALRSSTATSNTSSAAAPDNEEPSNANEPLRPDDTQRASLIERRRSGRRRAKAVSDGVALMASMADAGAGASAAPRLSMVREDSERIADLVFVKTNSLRDHLDPSEVTPAKPEGRGSLLRRSSSRRQKSNSDGVAEMRMSGRRAKSNSDGVADMAAAGDDDGAQNHPGRRMRSKTNSDGVASMKSAGSNPSVKSLLSGDLDNPVKIPTEAAVSSAPIPDSEELSLEGSETAIDPAIIKMTNVISHELEDAQRAVSQDPKDLMRQLASTGTTGDEQGTGGDDKDKEARAAKYIREASMRSLASDGEHSDFDDVPEADPAMMRTMTVVIEQRNPSWRDKARKYFLSKQYPVMSNVFGTMISFFVVGSRVERFLHTENIVSEEWISFDFGETITFWTFTTLVSIFLGMSVLIRFLLGPYYDQFSLRGRKLWVAAVLDFIVCAVVLVLFFAAEVQRCCNPEEEIFTEPVPTPYGFPAACACQTFGSRLHGGLGRIEPFASLVGLRLFRFWFASRIVKLLDKQRGTKLTPQEEADLKADRANLDPFDMNEGSDCDSAPGQSHHGHSHHHSKGHDDHHHDDHDHDDHHHHHNPKGTISELWEAALLEHPEIVTKYGEFSGELLQVMLGLPIVEKLENGPGSSSDNAKAPPVGTTLAKDETKAAYLIDQQYAHLSTGAQEIIMAGKMGKAVVSYPEKVKSETITIQEHFPLEGAVRRSMLFKVSDLQGIEDGMDMDGVTFDSPNSRLIRSMRRCERQVLPILDHWSVVDVVMTRFEIVYFDAVGADNQTTDSHEALIATKGGKGLRLCDVAKGRRVVGHLSLSDITSVRVCREMPHPEPIEDTHIPEEELVSRCEYWHPKNEGVAFNRRELWHKVKEDRLTVDAGHGHTLYLRYYSDLDDAQNHPEHLAKEDADSDTLYKTNALQWAQTIGRICGPEQLRQPLAHFGDDTCQELRDYLVVHNHEVDTGTRRKSYHRQRSSASFRHGSGHDLDDSHHAIAALRRPTGPARRASSFGEHFPSAPRKSLRRYASTGDKADNHKADEMV